MMWLLPEDFFGGRQRVKQRGSVRECQDKNREDACGQSAGRVSMSKGGELDAQAERGFGWKLPRQTPTEQSYGRDPHHAATSFAVISGRVPKRLHGLQRRQASHAGRTTAMQLPLLEQPAWLVVSTKPATRRPLTLRLQPAQVGVGRHSRVCCDPLEAVAHPGSQQALGCKQGHLRVVSDHAQATIGGGISRETLRPKATQDL